LRGDVLSQFFINRAKCINCDYYDIDYKVRCYIPFKGTRRLVGNFKNSISISNRPTNRENIPLGLLIKIPEKSKSRFLNTESREIFIFFKNDRKSSSQNRLQFSLTDINKDGNIIIVPKSILSLSGTFSTPHFIGTNITNFLINYKNICKDYNIEKESVFVVVFGTILRTLLLL
jgi:hypothetical protein